MKFKVFSGDEGGYKYFVILCSEEKPYEIIKEIDKLSEVCNRLLT